MQSSARGDSAGAGGKTKLPRAVWILFVSLVIDLLGFTLILPLLPSLLEYYGSLQDPLYLSINGYVQGFRAMVGAPDTPRWNGVLFGGVVGGWFSLLQFLATPAFGAASDVYGRRPLMLLSMVGVAASYGLWAVSSSFTLFVLARTVGGLFKGNISLATAVVADTCNASNRGKGMAMIGIAFSLGFLIGPLIGAGFASWARSTGGATYTPPALFALALAVIDVVYIALMFPETLPSRNRAKSVVSSLSGSAYLVNPVSLFRFSAVQGSSRRDLPRLRSIGLVYFTYMIIYSGLEFTLTFLTHNRFQYDSMQQGKMFFVMGTAMALIQGGYVRRVKSGKEKKMALQGIVVLMLSFVVLSVAHSRLTLYAGVLLFSFSSATVIPSFNMLVSGCGAEDQRGTITGISRSLGALARALGPLIASTVYWSYGATPCYLVGAALLFIPLLLAVRLPATKARVA